jgi:hypothetical protein
MPQPRRSEKNKSLTVGILVATFMATPLFSTPTSAQPFNVTLTIGTVLCNAEAVAAGAEPVWAVNAAACPQTPEPPLPEEPGEPTPVTPPFIIPILLEPASPVLVDETPFEIGALPTPNIIPPEIDNRRELEPAQTVAETIVASTAAVATSLAAVAASAIAVQLNLVQAAASLVQRGATTIWRLVLALLGK